MAGKTGHATALIDKAHLIDQRGKETSKNPNNVAFM
jgi:hypothetical protein